ncbi:nucleoside diphosphate kinase regulator [Consotaella salsifontis]|uniref:Regulator of nucleoside diphosphate kinase n=1 Tax=Consotaella salsifontis TaxID=1365950 RepID=A0A1T4P9F6_9HYPH|nr:nucleoside diphosphate kinase regulator [Consotaella salsifontis]SJZ87876.1 regulator of nucleoside diphosphate kinase [Consotaella salsifontis]
MAPAPARKRQRSPSITIGQSDHDRLSRLADTYVSPNPEVIDRLLVELDRARVVKDERVAADVVRMGSTLRFTTDLGEDRRVTLVFPGQADIAEGKVSILTPIGAALIGLSTGQSIDWTARDGRVHRLTVHGVEAPTAI